MCVFRIEELLAADLSYNAVEALRRELGYLREEIIEKAESEWRDVPMYRAYAVLTICRILYSLEKGTVTSKPKAAKWAIKKLPRQFSGTILTALDFNRDQHDSNIPLERIKAFLTFAAGKSS